jgi:hypothetical protein
MIEMVENGKLWCKLKTVSVSAIQKYLFVFTIRVGAGAVGARAKAGIVLHCGSGSTKIMRLHSLPTL